MRRPPCPLQLASQPSSELNYVCPIMIKHARKWTDTGEVSRSTEFTDLLRKTPRASEKGFRRCASAQIFHPEWTFLRADLCSRDDSKLCRRIPVMLGKRVGKRYRSDYDSRRAQEIPANFDLFRKIFRAVFLITIRSDVEMNERLYWAHAFRFWGRFVRSQKSLM